MAGPIAIDEARAAILAQARRGGAEEVALDRALGRVTAEPVVSDVRVPPFASSAMDGYAVPDTIGATLIVAGESRAGHPHDGHVAPGTAVAISTGAVVPEGTAAVVPIEDVTEAGGAVTVPESRPGAHVRGAGEDIEAGDELLAAGTELGPAALGVLASVGRTEVACAARPRVALMATGDELAAPGAVLESGQIWSSNGPVLAALVARAGGEVALTRDVPDTAEGTRDALAAGVDGADVVCVSGGVSVGPHDHVKGAFADLGVDEVFWRVALRPGKPTWFGTSERDGRRVLCFGLPGNPVSALVCFVLFVRPALLAMQGADPGATRVPVELAAPAQRMPGRSHAVRCRLEPGPGGWLATPTGPQGSHQLTSMLGAGALAVVPEGDGELPAGSTVEAELLE